MIVDMQKKESVYNVFGTRESPRSSMLEESARSPLQNNESREHKRNSKQNSLLVDEKSPAEIDRRRGSGNKRQEGGKEVNHSINNDNDETTPILGGENVQDLKGSNSDE